MALDSSSRGETFSIESGKTRAYRNAVIENRTRYDITIMAEDIKNGVRIILAGTSMK